MSREHIEYYKIKSTHGIQCIAAGSRDAVLRFLGIAETPTSLVSMFGYDFNTLERITKDEARKAPYFDKFALHYRLCYDGTWHLGTMMQD